MNDFTNFYAIFQNNFPHWSDVYSSAAEVCQRTATVLNTIDIDHEHRSKLKTGAQDMFSRGITQRE